MVERSETHRPPQNASHLAGAAGAVLRESIISHCVQLASPNISFDSLIETLSIKRFKPHAEPVKFRRSELRNSSFDFFDRGHTPTNSIWMPADKPVAV
jgi:hypothetical protein